jgi:two-component system osmolarity sensor histidine kinase EnvZ
MDYNLPGHTVNISFNKKTKEVEIEVGGVASGALLFHINHKKIFVQSTYTFIIWMIGSTLILLIITIIFAKNQIRSITQLSTIAGKLSKGQAVQRFIPHGATEVRNVGQAVLKMKQEIEDEVQRKSQMLAWVSHDLRTPLTRMKLQLALKERTMPKSLGGRVQALHSDICEMEKIINDYLDFIKGETSIKLKQSNLSTLVQTVIKTARIGAKATITTEIQPKVYAKINENQFKRALFNLLDNAKKFGSHIKVRLHQEPNKQILLEIHDNGPGIPASDMPNVFKPFYRSTKHGNVQGSGLGLPIVANIIRRHRGTVSLFQSHEGGLMVSISLPPSKAIHS